MLYFSLQLFTYLCVVACDIKGKEILADKYHTEIGDGKCTLTKCLVDVSNIICFGVLFNSLYAMVRPGMPLLQSTEVI